MPAPTDDKRLHPRRVTRLTARLLLPWGELEGTIENIGEGGLFFRTDTLEGSVAEGDRLEVVFQESEDSPPAALGGSVLRVERYFHEGELFRAFAIRFDEPYPS